MIDRKAAIEDAKKQLWYRMAPEAGQRIIDWLRGLPEAVPEAGQWVYDENGIDWGIPGWRCSSCGTRNSSIPTSILYGDGTEKPVKNPYIYSCSSYCPNCGIMMSKENTGG